ncbi:MAG: signal peptide peptidase SppA [Candidatus Binataceae bacterium]
MLKKFFKWIIRTVIVIVILIAIVATSKYISHRVPNDSVLVVTLSGSVVERGSNGVLGLVDNDQTPLNFVRRAIDRGAKDRRIVGLAVKVIDPQMDLAQAQEIAALIKSFRKTGKWTAAYIESAGDFGPGNLPYAVAAAADEVSLMPQGSLGITGVGIRELFARGTLDWIGIHPNFGAIGKYKSAGNIFTQKDFTPAQHEEDDALAGDMYNQIVAQIALERHIDPAAVKGFVDQAPLNADVSLKDKLVDHVEYEDQFTDRAKHRGGDSEHKLVDYSDYSSSGSIFASFAPGGDKLAIVYGSGAIERGQGGFDPMLSPEGNAMGADDIVAAFKSAREDDSVRGVVFRVNSPGGDVIASELIRRQVELTAAKKPVVISMSGYAASGGYWISTPAAAIIADPGTITGSIGVLGGKFNITPATQKAYLNTGAISYGANADMFDAFTDFTPAQAAVFQNQMLGDTYQYFVKIVAAGRHLSVEDVDAIAQGRVWMGDQALPIKLVDSLGTFDDALRKVKELARLDPNKEIAIEELPEQPSIIQALLSGRVNAAYALDADPARALGPIAKMIRAAIDGHAGFGAAYCPVVPML